MICAAVCCCRLCLAHVASRGMAASGSRITLPEPDDDGPGDELLQLPDDDDDDGEEALLELMQAGDSATKKKRKAAGKAKAKASQKSKVAKTRTKVPWPKDVNAEGHLDALSPTGKDYKKLLDSITGQLLDCNPICFWYSGLVNELCSQEPRPQMPFEDLEDLLATSTAPAMERRDHMWEVFSAPRVGPVLRSRGGRCSRSIDLSNFWNLTRSDIQHCLLSDVITRFPYLLMMGPPCTMVCSLVFSNWFRMDKVERERRLHEAVTLIDVAVWLATIQERRGLYYCIENPEGSQLWTRPNVAGCCSRTCCLVKVMYCPIFNMPLTYSSACRCQ